MVERVLRGLSSPVQWFLVRFSVELGWGRQVSAAVKNYRRALPGDALQSNGDAFVSCRFGLRPVLCSGALSGFLVIGNVISWPRLNRFSSKKHNSNNS